MIRIVLIALGILSFIYLLRRYSGFDAAAKKRFWAWFSFSLVFALVVFLTVTGRLHAIAAVVTALLPFAKRLLPLVRYVPLLRRLYEERKNNQEANGEGSAGAPVSAALSLAEAYQVLGLSPGATKQEIVDAHRSLMQKVHPDRGGNDYLAARINQAKDLLLEQVS